MKNKPAFILDFKLQPGSFDINVTPDKREVLLSRVRGLRGTEFFQPLPL